MACCWNIKPLQGKRLNRLVELVLQDVGKMKCLCVFSRKAHKGYAYNLTNQFNWSLVENKLNQFT
jgi:hypothetical protein